MSWVAFAALGDTLEAECVGRDLSLQVDGPFAASIPTDAENLVLRAAHTLRDAARAYGIPVDTGASLRLTKKLPAASGIGGGSADAAATLHLLNELWGLGADGNDLMTLGTEIGSDVPVCVFNRSALMSGRGEQVQPGPDLPAVAVVLVNPGVAVSTADVFARLTQRRGSGMVALPPDIRDAAHLAAVLQNTGNDMEMAAVAMQPVTGAVLDALRQQTGALLARMSGSGATCFALFHDDASAQAAAIAIKRARPAWWAAATRLDC
jgi:4-diphosphocytidyl-2-C-methyl-D-erythritol kinase